MEKTAELDVEQSRPAVVDVVVVVVENGDGETIQGYKSPMDDNGSPPSGHKSFNQQDEQLDLLDDVDRILSRPINRRILDIFDAPEFVQRLRSYDEAQLGETVTFTAQYHALPRPTVKWFKDEEEVRPTGRHELVDESPDSEGLIKLVIRDVTATDEGAYKCKVENREGVASTTGYLSVARKPSRRSRSNRTSGKLQVANKIMPGVSSPPFLGPIVEQKSQEEREELELEQQPPSPLQHFIDSIRRSGKSKHAPIFYGTGDIFVVQYDMDDKDNTTDDDIFGEDGCTPTGMPGTPNNGLDSESDHDVIDDDDANSRPEEIRLCAIDSFKSPEVDWSSRVSSSSAQSTTPVPKLERNGTDSGGTNCKSDGVVNSSAHEIILEAEAAAVVSKPVREFQRTRLGQLQLKHRLAIDLPECSSPPAGNETDIELSNPPSIPSSVAFSGNSDPLPTNNTAACSTDAQTPCVSKRKVRPMIRLESFGERLLDDISNPEVQFYIIFVACTAAVAALFQIPPTWLILLVAFASLISFCWQNRQINLHICDR